MTAEADLLRAAFVDPLEAAHLQTGPVVDVAGIERAVGALRLPLDRFDGASDQLRLGDVTLSALDGVELLEVRYALDGERRALAYRVGEQPPAQDALLVIPGSGLNQSTALLSGDGYHGDIVRRLRAFGDVYIFVKPNEDCRAIHDGRAKLSYDFVNATLLNAGASYSATYITGSMAAVKALQQRYARVFVLGLSQGGGAALLNALQTAPAACLVCSGFSALAPRFRWANFGQIIIPGLDRMFSNDRIRADIARSPTRFLFSHGRTDSADYRFDLEGSDTRAFLAPLANAVYLAHDSGHCYPEAAVEDFLHAVIRGETGET